MQTKTDTCANRVHPDESARIRAGLSGATLFAMQFIFYLFIIIIIIIFFFFLFFFFFFFAKTVICNNRNA